MNKKDLLDDLQNHYQQFEALLAQIHEDRMDQPGVAGHWSVKDIVAHLTGWRKRTVARLQAARKGEADPPPPWPASLQTDDEINAWIYERNHSRTVREVLDDSRQTFQSLVTALDAFTEEELANPGRFPWSQGQPLTGDMFFAHYHEEHEADMRNWLEQQEKLR